MVYISWSSDLPYNSNTVQWICILCIHTVCTIVSTSPQCVKIEMTFSVICRNMFCRKKHKNILKQKYDLIRNPVNIQFFTPSYHRRCNVMTLELHGYTAVSSFGSKYGREQSQKTLINWFKHIDFRIRTSYTLL